MIIGSLGRRYARALLELAREEERLEDAGEELTRAAQTFADGQLRAVLTSPAIAARDRAEITRRVISSLGVSTTVGHLLALLADRDRLSLLPDIVRAYDDFLDGELGRVRTVIRSAVQLAERQRAEIVELVRRLTGRREVKVTTEVDPDLLGGVELHVGTKVYDGTLKTQLQRLSRQMAAGGS